MKAKEINFFFRFVLVHEWLTGYLLTVDPTSVNPGERATKLRCQQEVRGVFLNSRNGRFLTSVFLSVASRLRLHLVSSSDQPSSADAVERQDLLSGLACQECQAHDSR
jgi:hypothetical protein